MSKRSRTVTSRTRQRRRVAEAGLEEHRDVVSPLRIEDGRSGQSTGHHVGDDGQRLVFHLDELAGISARHGSPPAPWHDLADESHAVPRHGELAQLLHLHVHARGEPRGMAPKSGKRLHPALEVDESEDVDHAGEPARRLRLHERTLAWPWGSGRRPRGADAAA